jgi:Dolichyl-phosphate-mannose-protein mannosyltransferase
MTEPPAPLEDWLERHRAAVAIVVLGIGFLLRIRAAGHNYLNPDEALIYIVANQPSLAASYKLSLLEAHPPLYYFLLHFWRLLGRSELILRLPSVLAGSAAPWFIYKWLKIVFGARTAWIGLLLVTFSPAVISLSAEARQYALLLFFLAAALYFLESALEESSSARMALFGLFLFLAIVTHYATLWFAIASGIYALGRFRPGLRKARDHQGGRAESSGRRPDRVESRRSPPSRAVAKVWLGAMAGAAALFLFFYATHIARLRSSGLISQMENTSWISGLYFHPAKTSALQFLLGHTVWFFEYLVGQEAIGFMMAAMFLVVVCLLLDPQRPLAGKAPPRLIALLLFLPFLMAIGAGLARLYPYGPAREDLWLAPFAMAGAGYGLSELGGRRRAWPGLGLAGLVVLSGLSAVPIGIRLSPNMSRKMFDVPLGYIRQAVPRNQPVLSDFSTMLPLGYYLCDDRGFPLAAMHQDRFAEYRCGGYRFLLSPRHTFTPAHFPDDVEQAARTYGLAAGEWLWVAHGGWGDHLAEKLARRFPELRTLPRQDFNEGVAIFQVKVPRKDGPGQGSGPAARASRRGGPARLRRALVAGSSPPGKFLLAGRGPGL